MIQFQLPMTQQNRVSVSQINQIPAKLKTGFYLTRIQIKNMCYRVKENLQLQMGKTGIF